MNYHRQEIADTCNEIEKQWKYLLFTRSVFPYNLTKSLPRYKSPPFYKNHGINFIIEIPEPFIETMKPDLEGINHWLNQNFIIRLFGILDEKNIITAGKQLSNPFSEILALLRHQVGAHTRGYRKQNKNTAKKVTRLIIKYLDDRVLPDDIERFNLTIDTVLMKLKDECITFVYSLEGKKKPEKGKKDNI